MQCCTIWTDRPATACVSIRKNECFMSYYSRPNKKNAFRTWNVGATSSSLCAISSTPGTLMSRCKLAPSSSTMLDHELKSLCKKLKPALGRRADALWLAYLTAETIQSKRDAEVLIQMLVAKHLGQSVSDETILLPPPSREAAEGDFLLGTIIYGRTALFPLYLRSENFVKHIGIFSITGGGKTNVAQILVLGLLRKAIPFIVVDWKRSYRALRSLRDPAVNAIQIFTVGRKTASPFTWN